jgi:hypothetical protein
MPATCRAPRTCCAPCAWTDAGGALGRGPRCRHGGERRRDQARRARRGAQPRRASARCRRRAAPLDVPCRRAGTNAGGAIDREALDASTVASGAKIKPGEPGKRSTASRSMLGGVPRAGIKPGEAGAPLRREPFDAADVPHPLTCAAAAPGTVAGGAIGREALGAGTVAERRQHQARRARQGAPPRGARCRRRAAAPRRAPPRPVLAGATGGAVWDRE